MIQKLSQGAVLLRKGSMKKGETMEKIEGYKAFDKNLCCRGFQFEIGKEFKFDGEPIPCKQGFHFCMKLGECYDYYPAEPDTRICKVEALGEVKTDDEIKYCTNHIKILEEVEDPREESNSGDRNSGYRNSGDRNSGYMNSGDRNSGNRNSGDWNSGDWNSGDWNSGDWNSGIFCTEKNPKIKMFDKDSNWTMDDWNSSRARRIMEKCPYTYSDFILADDMSDDEKEQHPEHETIGGYIKTFAITNQDKQKWWDNLSSEDKQEIYKLPNFDAEKFKSCTEIDCTE